MRFSLVVVGALAVLFTAPAIATSLKLANEIELLAVDGKVISGALLKGAESLELDGGEHQLLFKVNKVLTSPINPIYYSSPPLLLSFNGHNTLLARIKLPSLSSLADSQHFDMHHDFQLIDSNNQQITIRRDVFAHKNLSGQMLENALADYNRSDNPAAALSFTPSAVNSDDDSELNTKGSSSARMVKRAGTFLEKVFE